MRSTILCTLLASFALVATDAAARVHTGTLGGIVLERNGRPSVGAAVIVERSDGSVPLAGRTDSQGRFLFKFVRPGVYDVRASHGSSASAWKHNIFVRAGKETALDLRLEPIRSQSSK